MKVHKFSLSDSRLVMSPRENADIFVGNLIDERQAGPVTIVDGRCASNQLLMKKLPYTTRRSTSASLET